MAMRRTQILQPFMNLLSEFGNFGFVQTVFKSIEDPVRSSVDRGESRAVRKNAKPTFPATR